MKVSNKKPKSVVRYMGRSKKTAKTISSGRPVETSSTLPYGYQVNPFDTKIVKSEIKFYPWMVQNISLNHNSPSNYASILDSITGGSANYQRVGNAIKIKSLRLKLHLRNKADRPNVAYRVTVYFAPRGGGNYWDDCRLLAGTNVGNNMVHDLDPAKCWVAYDKVVLGDPGALFGTAASASFKERGIVHWADIPVNKQVVWNHQTNECRTNMVVNVIAYDTYSTLTTDTIATYDAIGYVVFEDN